VGQVSTISLHARHGLSRLRATRRHAPSFVQIDPLDASSTSHAFSGERTACETQFCTSDGATSPVRRTPYPRPPPLLTPHPGADLERGTNKPLTPFENRGSGTMAVGSPGRIDPDHPRLRQSSARADTYPEGADAHGARGHLRRGSGSGGSSCSGARVPQANPDPCRPLT
jgi:hypothetical protein